MFTHRVLWHFIACAYSLSHRMRSQSNCGQCGQNERQNKRELTMRMYNKCGKKRFSCTLHVILPAECSFHLRLLRSLSLFIFRSSPPLILVVYMSCVYFSSSFFITLFLFNFLHCFVYFLFLARRFSECM